MGFLSPAFGRRGLPWAVVVALLAISAAAESQLTANPLKNSSALQGGAVALPGTNLPGGMQNLTPEQVQSIIMQRALQSRGSRRVRTGFPQFIPLGGPGFAPYPQAIGPVDQPQPDAKREAARQRRIEARKAAEEKKRAAREAAKAKAQAKKADPNQAKPAHDAPARGQPAAKQP